MVQVPARVRKTLMLMLVPHIHGHALAAVEMVFSLSLMLVGLVYAVVNAGDVTGENLLAFIMVFFGAICGTRCLFYFLDEFSDYHHRDR